MAGASPAALLRPLPEAISPSATHGRIAGGTFHQGIDLLTGGRELPVAAASDGEIVRARIGASGHGKAVHLLLPDGREILYGHLSSFMPALEESCRAMQWRSGRMEIDWRPPATAFTVRRGEWIGRTGRTADGRSLLHVEMRLGGSLVDPLRHGFAWPDTSRPRIGAIRFVPLGPDARVDGSLRAKSIQPADGRRSLLPATSLWGPIGIECESWDEISGQRTLPAAVLLDLDGAHRFTRDLETEIGEIAWISEPPEPGPFSASVQRLYEEGRDRRGWLQCGTELPAGDHGIRVICRDALGNADTAAVGVRVQPNPRVDEWMARPLSRGGWDIAVHLRTHGGEDLERTRLWVDLTEDGLRFPIRTLLGHIGSGWYLGELSAVIPSGAIGLRVRVHTPGGLEVWGPPLSLAPSGLCATGAVGPPEISVAPRWLMASFRDACLSYREPEAALLLPGLVVPCALLDVPDLGEAAVWRFAGEGPATAGGISPRFVLRVEDDTLEWRLPGVVAANDWDDLLWRSPDGAFTMEAHAGTFLGPVWLQWKDGEPEEEGARPIKEAMRGLPPSEERETLAPRSRRHAIEPRGIDLGGPFRLNLRPTLPPASPEEARRLLVFGRSETGGPWEVRGGVWTGSEVAVVVDQLEEWILLEDRTEPWIYAMEPSDLERRSHPLSGMSARIREDGSGVLPGDVEVRLDGHRVPASWSPWSRAVSVDLAEPLARGQHRWDVQVTDRAGNRARRSAAFVVIAEP
ncbi:MAG: M23 family metallopeptidase [Candidatus Eisenbacteria bacterium]|nr:M23 family metallopeptidase [Candidatus Eisenbacteria bacterium]